MLRSTQSIRENDNLTDKWTEFGKIIIKMLDNQTNKRPSCDDLLKDFSLWSNTANDLKCTEEYHQKLELIRSYKNQFFYEFLKEKLV